MWRLSGQAKTYNWRQSKTYNWRQSKTYNWRQAKNTPRDNLKHTTGDNLKRAVIGHRRISNNIAMTADWEYKLYMLAEGP